MNHPQHVVNTQAAVFRGGRYLMIVRGEFEEHAPGALSPPGGKVEYGDDETGVIEATLRREVLEETGVTVGEMSYIRSRRFESDEGTSIVDLAFLCKYQSGEAFAADPDEVAEVYWLTAEEIMVHPKTRPWTQATMQTAEKLRNNLSW